MVYFENRSALECEEIDWGALCDCQKDIEVLILGDEEMSHFNQTYRNKEGITDVLSFPYEQDVPNLPLGSIVMSATLIAKKAQEYGHSIEDEIRLLFIHGFLHLLGYDHEVDYGEHRAKEEEMIVSLGLPSSLIVRNS
ncbi:rRNA maturation RNase YbeY [Helicobacter enhydrae]|uniref:Endoribonuclease YbeY n=1 Tax=Helicobacter enhydrae TaxID=222136 RepID=A0A1B1U5C6_9HELI|nr:rRNA maturation RNase YbeY [Helicobacter enhydrae]ANV97973.1 rRNA maturation RNase YbeY [Helicobacter enhydrae]